jgi:hypothetical protein
MTLIVQKIRVENGEGYQSSICTRRR